MQRQPGALVAWCTFLLSLSTAIDTRAGSTRVPPTAEQRRAAEALVLGWFHDAAVPGQYVDAGFRERYSRVEGDLTQVPTYWAEVIGRDGGLGNGGWLHHTRPNPAVEVAPGGAALAQNSIDYLLRKGLSRSLESAVAALDGLADADDLEPLLGAVRRVVSAYEDFRAQVADTIARGPGQVNGPADDEYGPETNFWVKARGYVTCAHQPRRGPEVGGSKFWCNPASLGSVAAAANDDNGGGSGGGSEESEERRRNQRWRRPFVLSAGSGGDFAYEQFAAAAWPDGSTIVTLDCTSISEASVKHVPAGGDDGNSSFSTLVELPLCLTGDDPTYLVGVFDGLKPKFVTWGEMLGAVRAADPTFDHFDVVKVSDLLCS